LFNFIDIMALICYHASHEQFAPSDLIKYAVLAEEAGFDGIHSSDHFHPWSKRQGHSGFSFCWIAAAMQATRLPFSMVCAPGQRYHPAIVAQAIATLDEMFPGRIDIELGSGEALNEHITGDEWPAKEIRNSRLQACAQIIRSLLNGEEVSYEGYVRVKEAKLYTLPKRKPRLLCAAISKDTAAWAGSWADGLLTSVEQEPGKTMDKIAAFQKNAGAGKAVFLQYAFSYARNHKQAEEGAFDQWRSNILPREKLADLRKVNEFDAAGESVTLQEVVKAIPVFTSIGDLMEKVREMETTGAERIILHNINRPHIEFMEDYKRFKQTESGNKIKETSTK
jgi:coenzyme F420-dependent glucose-6-phosphate dehydrogenase